jgi:hypothetical protein
VSAAFISIEIAGAPADSPALRTITLHDNGPLLDERTVWRDAASRFDNLDHAAVGAVYHRLGIHPPRSTPIERVVETLASSSVCESDESFIRRVWLTIFAREPNGIERSVLLRLLREEGSRLKLIQRIGRMTEFRDAITTPAAPPAAPDR